MGSVGFIYSGAVYFDARSSADGDSAIYNEGDSLDPYYGHSNDASQYHYHAVSTYIIPGNFLCELVFILDFSLL